MMQKYIWLLLKILISLVLVGLIYLDVLLMISYGELAEISSAEGQKLTEYQPELGIFSLPFFVFGGVIEFFSLFGDLFEWMLPILLIAINIILLITILFAVLIFKEKTKLLLFSSLLVLLVGLLFVGGA